MTMTGPHAGPSPIGPMVGASPSLRPAPANGSERGAVSGQRRTRSYDVPVFDLRSTLNALRFLRMTFPHYFRLFGHAIHPHPVMELIGYSAVAGDGPGAAGRPREMMATPDQPEDPTDAPPPRPAPLDYRGRSGPGTGPTTPVALQAFLGFVAWLAGTGGVAGIAFAAANARTGTPTLLVPLLTVALLLAILLGSYVRFRLGWRGFIPGMLLGFGLTCLVPVGIVAVVCGPWNR